MLSIRSDKRGISAANIFLSSTDLANSFKGTATAGPFIDRSAGEVPPSTVVRLESIAKSLEESTIVLISRDRKLETTNYLESNNDIIEKMNSVFSNAITRSKKSWRISVVMTVVSFGLITIMLLAAITTSVVTGSSGWGLIFGGASVAFIIGTLLWRPFDRMFRATILAQQLEMIHLQTIAGFQATVDIERRIQICSEAIVALGTLFKQHDAQPDKGKIKEKDN
jgi:hypothetical protein